MKANSASCGRGRRGLAQRNWRFDGGERSTANREWKIRREAGVGIPDINCRDSPFLELGAFVK